MFPTHIKHRDLSYLMEFFHWLQEELNKRNWSQRDLVKNSQLSGYPISQAQLSRIMTGGRQAGPEACIAIAHALGVSREEVFKARGWLFDDSSLKMEIDPRTERLAREVSILPPPSRELILDVIEPLLSSVRKFTGKISELSTNGHENEN